jgi:hypothetical protein
VRIANGAMAGIASGSPAPSSVNCSCIFWGLFCLFVFFCVAPPFFGFSPFCLHYGFP